MPFQMACRWASRLQEEFHLHSGQLDHIVILERVRRGADLLAALGDFLPWYGAEARILLAHASLWLADLVGARTLLSEMR